MYNNKYGKLFKVVATSEVQLLDPVLTPLLKRVIGRIKRRAQNSTRFLQKYPIFKGKDITLVLAMGFGVSVLEEVNWQVLANQVKGLFKSYLHREMKIPVTNEFLDWVVRSGSGGNINDAGQVLDWDTNEPGYFVVSMLIAMGYKELAHDVSVLIKKETKVRTATGNKYVLLSNLRKGNSDTLSSTYLPVLKRVVQGIKRKAQNSTLVKNYPDLAGTDIALVLAMGFGVGLLEDVNWHSLATKLNTLFHNYLANEMHVPATDKIPKWFAAVIKGNDVMKVSQILDWDIYEAAYFVVGMLKALGYTDLSRKVDSFIVPTN